MVVIVTIHWVKVMKLIPVLKREAIILATLYDLSCPFSPFQTFPHVYYLESNLAKLLYAKYLLDKFSAWDEVFEAILRGSSNEVVEILRSIEVYKWEDIKEILRNVAREVLELHKRFMEKFVCYTRKIFGFSRYFSEVYLILGFNPLLHTSHGNGMGNVKRFPVIACFVNDLVERKTILDIAYHEILHRLIWLNNKRRLEKHLPSKYEWFKREYELLRDRVEEYFKNRIYEQTTIIEYLKDLLKDI